MSFLHFFREFLTSPGDTGAIAPSSRTLARRVIDWLDLAGAEAVVEYGPGTGAFTGSIVRSLPGGCKFFAIELNEKLADILRNRFPGVPIYIDSVKNVQDLCSRQGIAEVDCIVSGLPWSCFSEEKQSEYLDAMMTVLRRGGQFITFAYPQGLLLPAGFRFRRKLEEYFSEVSRSPIVWRNIPPAFIYSCRR